MARQTYRIRVDFGNWGYETLSEERFTYDSAVEAANYMAARLTDGCTVEVIEQVETFSLDGEASQRRAHSPKDAKR